MLESLSLAGFQSFRYEQSVRLAPLTLLFGPNSSGKTAILRALRMLDQTLTEGGELIYNGDSVRLGSFASTVFRGDVDQDISLRFAVDCLNLPLTYFEKLRRRFMQGFVKTLVPISADITLHFDSDSRMPKKVDISARFGVLDPPETEGAEEFSARRASDVEFETLHSAEVNLQRKKKSGVNATCTKLEISDVETFQPAYEHIDDLSAALRNYLPDFTFFSRDLVPSKVKRSSIDGEGARRTAGFCEGFLRFFGELLKPPITNNVGPVRKELPEVPAIVFAGQDQEQTGRIALRADASNLVEYLFALPEDRFQRGPEWLRKITDGRFGYTRTVFQGTLEGPQPGWVYPRSGFGQISFLDFHNKTVVSPGNSGAGLTQVLPVLASLLNPKKALSGAGSERDRIALIEQPELHLHPAMQAELVEVFVNSFKKTPRDHRAQIIAETHSESMLLRVQKLVREGRLDPSEVAILFVDQFPELEENGDETGATGSYVQEIRLAKDGSFRDRWPLSFGDVRWSEFD